MTASSPDGAAAKGPGLLLPFALGHMANDWAPAGVWILAPAIGAAMALSPAEIGLLITLHSLGASLAYFPAGVLADRSRDRGRLLGVTFWWVAIGYALASFAPGFWSLALLMALAGMGDAAWHPIATGVLVGQNRGRRAHALGVHAVGGTLSEVLSPLAVGFLLAFLDWRETLLISCLPAAIMGLVFLKIARRVPPARAQKASRADWQGLWHAWSRPRGLALVALICLYNMALFALMSMSPLYLIQVKALGPVETGLAFSAMMLIGALSQPFAGHLSDRRGRRPVVLGGCGIAVVAALALWQAEALWLVLALMALAMGVLIAVRSAILAAAVELVESRESTVLGLAFALMDGIGSLGALCAGIVAVSAIENAFLLAALFALASLVLTLSLPPKAPAEAGLGVAGGE